MLIRNKIRDGKFRRRGGKLDTLIELYNRDSKFIEKTILSFDKRLKKLEKGGNPSILEKIYKHGVINPLKENIQMDLLQNVFTLPPMSPPVEIFGEKDFKGRGFLANSLVAASSNLLGMEIVSTLRGRELVSFRGTILDLIVLGRINPNSRPPSGGLFCTLVGAPLWVVELEISDIYLRPFDSLTIRFYSLSPVPIVVSRCTLGYLFFLEDDKLKGDLT